MGGVVRTPQPTHRSVHRYTLFFTQRCEGPKNDNKDGGQKNLFFSIGQKLEKKTVSIDNK